MKILQTWQAALLLACITAFTFTSCKKDSGANPPPTDEDKPERPGIVTGIGTPVGPAISTVIGVNGGSLTSTNGELKIDIPAGAFTADQTVSIQPITNLNKAGTGIAWRLTPHNITFNKPVTLTFNYADSNIENSIAPAINASYQDSSGVWQSVARSTRDTTNKKVIVKTTHFSDWSLFTMLRIKPWNSFVDPGATLELKIYKMVEAFPPMDNSDFSIPRPDVPIVDSTEAIVKDWSTAGGGFTLGNGSAATYYAPSQMPNKNPVVITAHVEATENQQWTMVAFVYVGKQGINYRMNDGPWINAPVVLGAVKVSDTLHMIQGAPIIDNQPAGSMSISWKRGNPGFVEKWTNKLPAFQYGTGGIVSYFQYKPQGSQVIPSPGHLTFMEHDGDYVSATFLLTKAGKLTATIPVPQWGETKFEGFFRAKWKK